MCLLVLGGGFQLLPKDSFAAGRLRYVVAIRPRLHAPVVVLDARSRDSAALAPANCET